MGLPGPDGNWKGYDLSDLSAKAAKFHGKNFFLIHGKFFIIFAFPGQTHRERRTESKTDSYSKDLLFLALFAFCVITFEPIMI